MEAIQNFASEIASPVRISQGKANMATVQKNPAGSDYVMQIKYPQGEYGTEGGAQFYQRLKSMCIGAVVVLAQLCHSCLLISYTGLCSASFF